MDRVEARAETRSSIRSRSTLTRTEDRRSEGRVRPRPGQARPGQAEARPDSSRPHGLDSSGLMASTRLGLMASTRLGQDLDSSRPRPRLVSSNRLYESYVLSLLVIWNSKTGETVWPRPTGRGQAEAMDEVRPRSCTEVM